MELKRNLYIMFAVIGLAVVVAALSVRDTSNDAVGLAMAKDCYMYNCKCGPYTFSVSDGGGCPSTNDGYSCTETRYKVRCSD